MRAVFLLFFSSILFFIPFLKKDLFPPFYPSKLQVKMKDHLSWASPVYTKSEIEKIKDILSQPLTFLGNGSQCFAFETLDQKYVVKIFRYNRPKFSFIQKFFAFFRKTEKAPLFEKIDKTFQGYLLAHTLVPEGTKVFYAQFNLKKAPLLSTLTLSDPLNRAWKLPSNKVRFVIQEKVQPFQENFLRVIQDFEEGKRLLKKVISLLKKRAKKHIRNSDHNIWPNFGFSLEDPVEIDCGNYRYRESLKEPKNQWEEISRFSSQLRSWLAQHGYVSLAFFLDEEMEKIKEELFKKAPL